MQVFIVYDDEYEEVISVHAERHQAEQAAKDYIKGNLKDCNKGEFTGFVEDYFVSVSSYEVKE